MTEQEMRLLDIRLAIAFEYSVKKATLYSPGGTLLGGDLSIHIGSKPETDEDIANIWLTYSPRFTKDMRDAMWLLTDSFQKFHVEYNLFIDNNFHHTCEFGFWRNEPGQSDQLWQANEAEPTLAIAKAVAQCPVVMGAWAVKEKGGAEIKYLASEEGIFKGM